jgi:hypothetical protein
MLFISAHDYHFLYVPDVVQSIFAWSRPVSLVSVSPNGEDEPSIFTFSDILLAASDSSFQPSAISEINGRDAIDVLEELSQVGTLHDRDALWNNLFVDLSQLKSGGGAGLFSGAGDAALVYPGPTTTLTFENGTSSTWRNTAKVQKDFTNIKTGADLYQQYFTPQKNAHLDLMNQKPGRQDQRLAKILQTSSANAKRSPLRLGDGYPNAVSVDSENTLGGYYLDGNEHSDTAVLSVTSFGSEEILNFQSTIQQFLAGAKSAGKTKLVIDLSSNGGGLVMLGYELFKLLFPQMDPYGASRLRAHPTVDGLGQVFSEVASKYANITDVSDPAVAYMMGVTYNYHLDLNVDGKHFQSWKEKFGPYDHQGDQFTTPQREDLAQLKYGRFEITGYGNRTNFTSPFAAEDMVVLYNGYCGSTCSIFSELIRQQGKVSTIAIGGRLRNKGPIQGVGGTKGTQVLNWGQILGDVTKAFAYATPEQKEMLSNSSAAQFNSLLPLYRASNGLAAINYRDGLRKGDPNQTPLEFLVEPTDCRLYYTPDMTVNMATVWKAAADAKWRGKKCVAGGFPGQVSDSKANKRGTKSKAISVQKISPATLQRLHESINAFTDYVTWKSQPPMVLE